MSDERWDAAEREFSTWLFCIKSLDSPLAIEAAAKAREIFSRVTPAEPAPAVSDIAKRAAEALNLPTAAQWIASLASHEINADVAKFKSSGGPLPILAEMAKKLVGLVNSAIASACRERDAEIERLRELVVWGHYEQERPIYVQGRAGEHEINAPVTAKGLNKMVTEIERLRGELNAANARAEQADPRC